MKDDNALRRDDDRTNHNEATRLLVTRHGETLWNRHGLIQGHRPVPLSDLGRRQAQALGRRLAQTPLAAVYSSDLRRAVETVELAFNGLGPRVQQVAGLRECGYGEWEGLSSFVEDEGETGDPTCRKRRRRVGEGSSVPHPEAAPGGETLLQVVDRFSSAIEEIAARHRGETVLIVSHQGPLRAWFAQLLGWDLARCWDIEIDHCGLSEVEITPHGARLLRLEGRVI